MIIIEKIPSELRKVPSFVSQAIDQLSTLPIDIDDKELFKIKLCLEEALCNAVKHGNKLRPDLYAKMAIEYTEDRLVIRIEDQGSGFDFANLPDPTKKENAEKPSGRGIFLIKKFMDEVEFFSGGRGIKMIKKA